MVLWRDPTLPRMLAMLAMLALLFNLTPEARCTKWTLGLETAVYTAVWEQTTRDHTDFVKVIIVEYFDGFFSFLSYRQKVLDLILINSLRFSYRFSLQYTGVFFLIYRYLFA